MTRRACKIKARAPPKQPQASGIANKPPPNRDNTHMVPYHRRVPKTTSNATSNPVSSPRFQAPLNLIQLHGGLPAHTKVQAQGLKFRHRSCPGDDVVPMARPPTPRKAPRPKTMHRARENKCWQACRLSSAAHFLSKEPSIAENVQHVTQLSPPSQ